jgi:hypothetical protein
MADAEGDAALTTTVTNTGGLVFRSAKTGARLFSLRSGGTLRVAAMTGQGFPSWYALRNVDLVLGETLDRLCLPATASTLMIGKQCTAWLKAGHSLRELQCDRCPGPHSAKQMACSATLGVPTAMVVPDRWYDVHTGATSRTQWAILDLESGRSRVSRVTLQRIQ